jgi:thiamine pyrophosphate-dependent acetolactate synthase large subunit-like protein
MSKLRELVEKLNPPVATSLMGKACFSNLIPTSSGTAATIQELNRSLTPSHLVIADPGDCLFASVEQRTQLFIGPGYHARMVLAIPGAITAQIAPPELRPVTLG